MGLACISKTSATTKNTSVKADSFMKGGLIL